MTKYLILVELARAQKGITKLKSLIMLSRVMTVIMQMPDVMVTRAMTRVRTEGVVLS